MKNGQLIILLIFFGFTLTGYAQNELSYNAEMSEKKKASKSKQLEGLSGDIEKVILKSEKENEIVLDILFKGYEGKYIKVFVLDKSGTRKLMVPPYFKKISSGRKAIQAKLKLANDSEFTTEFVEVVFTNASLRFKGISYAFEHSKQWYPNENGSDQSETVGGDSQRKRAPKVIEVQMVPQGKAREIFIR